MCEDDIPMPVEPASIHEIDLFSALGPAELALVAGLMRERHIPRKGIILLEGATGDGFYYVHSGLIKVYRTSAAGREQVLRLLGPGETFNDVPALDGGPNPASAAAMEPSVVYLLGQELLHRLVLEHPAVADAAIKRLSGALRHLVSVVGDLSFLHVKARLAKALIEQEEAIAEGRRTRYCTQLELAAITGTTREIVARALAAFEALGAVEIAKGRAHVTDRARLSALLEGGA
jgi:CRP/FNR family transcriptional regulator